MKKLMFLLPVLLIFGLWACGPSGPSEADLQAEAEAARLDSLSQVIEVSVEEVDENTKELKEALEELDELFPEEGQ